MEWSKADLHIHSDNSDGLASIPEIMNHVQDRTDLRVVAITDHNTIEGAVFARSLQEMYDFEVIVGEEVSTKTGHVIGLFLEESIPAGMSARDTVRAIAEQNAISVIPHPFSAQGVFGPGGRKDFDLAVEEWGFDAFEVLNSLPYLGWANGVATKKLASGHGIAATGGSDAHVVQAIGKCFTLFPGRTASDLRLSLSELSTKAETNGGALSLSVRYALGYPKIRRKQSWNWERCKAK